MLQEPKEDNRQAQTVEFLPSSLARAMTGSWMLEIKPTSETGLPPEITALITFDNYLTK